MAEVLNKYASVLFPYSKKTLCLLLPRTWWTRTGLPTCSRHNRIVLQVKKILDCLQVGTMKMYWVIGLMYRREGLGGHFIAGKSPAANEEPGVANLDVDYTFFDQQVWPDIAQRVPGFENIKVIEPHPTFWRYDHNVIKFDLIFFFFFSAQKRLGWLLRLQYLWSKCHHWASSLSW